MRKTKIVCTLGPASESEEIIKGLALAGMNVARLNFSHSTHDDHLRRINTVKKVRDELELPIAIMLDTKGPEYRIKTFEDGKIILCDNDSFTFTTEDMDTTNAALNSTLRRTFSTSLSTLVVLIAIFIFGGTSIKGFIFALLIGIIVGTYSSLCIATPLSFDFRTKFSKDKKVMKK